VSEQIIAAELHRDDDGTVIAITFDGWRFEVVDREGDVVIDGTLYHFRQSAAGAIPGLGIVE